MTEFIVNEAERMNTVLRYLGHVFASQVRDQPVYESPVYLLHVRALISVSAIGSVRSDGTDGPISREWHKFKSCRVQKGISALF